MNGGGSVGRKGVEGLMQGQTQVRLRSTSKSREKSMKTRVSISTAAGRNQCAVLEGFVKGRNYAARTVTPQPNWPISEDTDAAQTKSTNCCRQK